MIAALIIIWDHDSAIGQINAWNPHQFNLEDIAAEIEHVDKILEVMRQASITSTFACLGVAALEGDLPYQVPDQIRKIHLLGHEVCSHSWRHEWFPQLDKAQLTATLLMSKQALEKCIGVEGGIRGLVPPFNRPMSWYRRGAFSLGDRAWGFGFPGADLGGVIRVAKETGYSWIRVSYRPLWRKLARLGSVTRDPYISWKTENGMVCVPQNHVGFDEVALGHLRNCVSARKPLVLGAHPRFMFGTRFPAEHFGLFEKFAETVQKFQAAGDLKTFGVSSFLTSRDGANQD